MILKKLYGLNNYLLNLTKLFDLDKLPKILMLSGKKGQGKSTLIHHFISYIFDKTNYDLEKNTIKESNKLIDNISENYNPNVLYYNCNNKNVKIEDIRSLRSNLQKTSINNLNRFIIFDDVECLNDNCINALLKTIEEPSTTNYFILINNQSYNILDTLKSRSIEIKVFLSNDKIKSIIEKVLSDHQIEKKIDLQGSTLTPGNYLKYNRLILDNVIDLKDKLIINLEKLLKLTKQKKDQDFLNFAIYLINQHYYNESKKERNIIYLNNKRINIIKKINETNKLNLNYTNLITQLESYI